MIEKIIMLTKKTISRSMMRVRQGSIVLYIMCFNNYNLVLQWGVVDSSNDATMNIIDG